MKTLTCDICKKKMEDPVTNRNFFHLEHRDLCEGCTDGLELQIKNTIRAKAPFGYEWYNKFVMDSVEKAIQKGKV